MARALLISDAPLSPMPPVSQLTDQVVWIDTEERMRRAIGVLFDGHGLQASAVADGIAGLETVRRLRPKVVVLHRLEPLIEGYALCAAIRSDPSLQSVFIMVGASDYDHASARDLLRCGADITLRKPVEPDILLATVEDVFGGRLTSYPGARPSMRIVRYLAA